MLEKTLVWSVEPLHARLFIIYLAVVVCITVVRFARLLRSLFLPFGKRISQSQITSAATDSDKLAQSALANGLPPVSARAFFLDGDVSTNTTKSSEMLRLFEAAAIKFRYLWNMCQVDVVATKRLARLSLLLSFLVITYGAAPTFNEKFNESNLPGNVVLIATAHELLARLALGLLICAALYCGAIVFEASMTGRKAQWDYFYESAISSIGKSL